MGRNQKRNKKEKIETGSRKVNSAVKGEQCVRGNFVTLLSTSSLLLVSASLFFLFLTYSSEFDSNSSCLDRLNNFDKNRLRKLQH